MKRISILMLALLCALLMFGCNNNTNTGNTETVPNAVAWSSTEVDDALIGVWQVEGSTTDEVRIFTDKCKIRIATGSVYLEGDVMYGVNSSGQKMMQSDFNYMAGEFTYVVNSEKAIFVNEEGINQTLIKVKDYKAPELAVPEGFNPENPLIGTWYNEEYLDSYTFSADGTAAYNIESSEPVFKSHIDFTYKVVDDKIHFTYESGNGVENFVSTYTIKDGVLDVDGIGGYVLQ